MNRTVDLVVTGDDSAAIAATADAAALGRRVLVVSRTRGRAAARRVRDRFRDAVGTNRHLVTIMTNAEVVCVDGLHGVEAVVIRHMDSGRLSAVNATGFVRCATAGSAEPGGRR